MEMHKILLPVTFSDRCYFAAHYAASLACRYQSELILFHAVGPPVVGYGSVEALAYSSSEDLLPQRIKNAEEALLRFAEEDFFQGLRMTRKVVTGDPAHAIGKYAHEEKVDLIVMPTHGYGPFRRFLLGSVTAKVLHDVDCPVWTGPHIEDAPADVPTSVHRILCAVDFGLQCRQILKWACSLAGDLHASLALLHVVPLFEVRLGSFYFDAEWREHLMREARECLTGTAEDCGLHADMLVETGEVAHTVDEVAARERVDLLIIGRSHQPGVIGRLRTNAYHIIRDSPCPVVSI